MAHSLIIKFREIRELQNNQTIINRQTVEFHSLKELAKRFALSFGLDALKNREAVTSLHQEGYICLHFQLFVYIFNDLFTFSIICLHLQLFVH